MVDCEWKYMIKTINVYPHPENSVQLHLNGPTDGIDINFLKKSKNAKAMLFFNDVLYQEIDISEELFKRIKFADPKSLYVSSNSKYLSDDIKKNTIDCSRVDKIWMVLIDCTIEKLFQNVYITYNYPSRSRISIW